MKSLRVTHCHNIAGVSSTLVKYQRRLGINSKVIVRMRHPNMYEYEKVKGLHKGFLTLSSSDVVHYHYSSWYTSLLGIRNFDARTLKRLGKKLIMHYHGDDLRMGGGIPVRFRHVFVTTPDLREIMPDAELLRNPIDPELFYEFSKPRSELRIGYYPAPYHKGGFSPTSDQLEEAVKQLGSHGIKAVAVAARGLPFASMPQFYNTLSVWVDKINTQIDAYAQMACEASLCGVPAIVGPNVEAPFHKFSGDLAADIEYLLTDDSVRIRVLQRSKDYVLSHHSPIEAAKRTISIYTS